MTIYDDLQGVAQELFAEFKQGVVEYVATTPGGGPVDNPGASTETTYSVNATVGGISQKYVDRGLAIGTDLQIRMSFDSRFVPNAKGFFTIDGVRCKILQIDKLPAAGTTIAYVIPVRKGG